MSLSSAAPEAIRADRAASGLSQTEYGALAGLTRAGIAQAESGRRKLSAGTWALLRARSAIVRGDETGALAVLRENLLPM